MLIFSAYNICHGQDDDSTSETVFTVDSSTTTIPEESSTAETSTTTTPEESSTAEASITTTPEDSSTAESTTIPTSDNTTTTITPDNTTTTTSESTTTLGSIICSPGQYPFSDDECLDASTNGSVIITAFILGVLSFVGAIVSDSGFFEGCF